MTLHKYQSYQSGKIPAVAHLINFFFGMCQKCWEMWESFTVEDNLCLLIGASDNVPHSSECSCLKTKHFLFKTTFLQQSQHIKSFMQMLQQENIFLKFKYFLKIIFKNSILRVFFKIESYEKQVFSVVAHFGGQIQTHLDFDFLVAEERNQVRDNSRVYHHLDLLVASVREIGESPDCVHQNLPGESSSVTAQKCCTKTAALTHSSGVQKSHFEQQEMRAFPLTACKNIEWVVWADRSWMAHQYRHSKNSNKLHFTSLGTRNYTTSLLENSKVNIIFL